MSAAARGDTGIAHAAVARIRLAAAADEPSGSVRTVRATMWTSQIQGVEARVRGDTTTALSRLRLVAQADDPISVSGPSRWIPGEELLGFVLLDAHQASEAVAAFTIVMRRFPNRPSAQLGLARAQNAVGNHEAARESYHALLLTSAHADAQLPIVGEAQKVLAQ